MVKLHTPCFLRWPQTDGVELATVSRAGGATDLCDGMSIAMEDNDLCVLCERLHRQRRFCAPCGSRWINVIQFHTPKQSSFQFVCSSYKYLTVFAVLVFSAVDYSRDVIWTC